MDVPEFPPWLEYPPWLRPPPTKLWPDHLTYAVGHNYLFAGIVASGYNFVKGFIKRPAATATATAATGLSISSSIKGRFAGGIGLARANTLRDCAVYGGAVALFTFMEQGLYYICGEQRHHNVAISAAIPAAAATARRGPLVASSTALLFGAAMYNYSYQDTLELQKRHEFVG